VASLSRAFVIAADVAARGGAHGPTQLVERAARFIVPHLRRGNLVVLESTVPRTTRDILAPIRRVWLVPVAICAWRMP
jgi:UDP-N-acetyl-D-mannosaminuronic acid dehydrogenase